MDSPSLARSTMRQPTIWHGNVQYLDVAQDKSARPEGYAAAAAALGEAVDSPAGRRIDYILRDATPPGGHASSHTGPIDN